MHLGFKVQKMFNLYNCCLFEAFFFEAFVDLFGAFFICLKDHFCVLRIILSLAKIYNSDGRVGEEKIE